MASERKTKANKRNSKSSGGPIDTSQTRFNALKHGILSTHVLVLGGEGEEGQREFRLFSDAVRSDLAPVGAIEELLVDELIVIAWRKRRVIAYESALLSKQTATIRTDYAQQHPISDMLHAILPRELVQELSGAAWQERQLESSETPGKGEESTEHEDKWVPPDNSSVESIGNLPKGSDAYSRRLTDPVVYLATFAAAARASLLVLMKDDSPDLTNNLVQSIVCGHAKGMGVPVSEILKSSTRVAVGETHPQKQIEGIIVAACQSRGISQQEFWAEVGNSLLRASDGANSELSSYLLEEDRETMLAGLPDDASQAKIQRYEAHLSRQFYRALHELQRLQAARNGSRNTAPLALDL